MSLDGLEEQSYHPSRKSLVSGRLPGREMEYPVVAMIDAMSPLHPAKLYPKTVGERTAKGH